LTAEEEGKLRLALRVTLASVNDAIICGPPLGLRERKDFLNSLVQVFCVVSDYDVLRLKCVAGEVKWSARARLESARTPD
jgi:hypothetical protein